MRLDVILRSGMATMRGMTDATDTAADALAVTPVEPDHETTASSKTVVVPPMDEAFDRLRQQVRVAMSATEARLRDAEGRATAAAADLARERRAREALESASAQLRADRDQLAERTRETVDGGRAAADLRDLIDRRDSEMRTLRAERDRLQRLLDALRVDVGRGGRAAGRSADELRGDLDAAGRRFEELRARSADEIARRDASIRSLGEQVVARDLQLAEERQLRKAAEKGGLDAEEARERAAYLAGRTGPARVWAALLVRSLPVVPLVAAAAAWVVRASGGGAVTPGRAFLVASGVGLSATALATLAGVYLCWPEVGPRWVWLRTRDARAGLLDVLTSTGERVRAPAGEFTLEVSFLLELLGLGTVRLRSTGLVYATTEPDAWRANLDRSQVRRRWRVDLATVALLVAWVAAAMWWA
jgi:hypothetical protein